MNDITPEQQKQLSSWVSQRDAILVDIGNKRTESERLTDTNKALGLSSAEISNKIQQSIGRLEELDRQEINRATFVLRDVADLDDRKSILQTEVTNLKVERDLIEDQKDSLLEDIANLSVIHDKIFEKTNGLESIIGNMTSISSKNATEINNILISAGEELQKIIDINRQNVVETNAVINKLPKMIFDLQRDIIERKQLNKHKISENTNLRG